MADENGFPPIAPPHPKIAWQLRKNLPTIAFVAEASVAYFTRTDFRGDEREKLRREIESLVSGRERLEVEMDVDEWMTKQRTPRQLRGDGGALIPPDAPPRSFGALPPPEFAWQMGKTVATLDFVREAEQALATRTDLDDGERYQLQAAIDRMKEGSEEPRDDDTVDAWLERLRDHYP
jgi:hypothetical protein